MSILFAGIEGEHFLFANTLDANLADNLRRGSIKLAVNDTLTGAFATGADIWARARYSLSPTISTPGTMENHFAIRDGAGVVLCALRDTNHNDGVSGRTELWTLNTASSTVLSAVSAEFTHTGTLDVHVWDFHVTIIVDTLTVKLYRDDLLVHTHTFTDAGRSWTNPADVQVKWRSSEVAGSNTYLQDVIVANTTTIGAELATMTPNEQGFHTAFAGDFTAVDDLGYDAGDTATVPASGLRESWVFDDPTWVLSLGKTISAVLLSSVVQLDTVPVITDFKSSLRIATVDHDSSALGANNSTPIHALTAFLTNPFTGIGWEFGELSGLEGGVVTT